jgi:hypothetical protein
MNKRTVLTTLLGLGLTAGVALAGELAGVTMPDTQTVDGKTVKLNGLGLRKKAFFKVYVAGLYLESPSKDGATVISADEIKSIRLHMLRDLKSQQITDAIRDGFERNSKAALPTLQERLTKLGTMIPDAADGDEIHLTYEPGKGTRVTARGTDRGTIEGRDFADALFSVWLGPNPVQDDLKKALLGG